MRVEILSAAKAPPVPAKVASLGTSLSRRMSAQACIGVSVYRCSRRLEQIELKVASTEHRYFGNDVPGNVFKLLKSVPPLCLQVMRRIAISHIGKSNEARHSLGLFEVGTSYQRNDVV